MTCSHCEHAIETEVGAIAGVCKVTADAASGTVTVESTRRCSTSPPSPPPSTRPDTSWPDEHHHPPRRLRGRPRRHPRPRRRASAPPSAPTSPTTEAEAPAPIGQGVVAAAEGYRLIPTTTALDPDGGTFRVHHRGPGRRAVHEFTPIHEQRPPPHRREPGAHRLPPRPPRPSTTTARGPSTSPPSTPAPTGPSPTSRSRTDPASPSAPTSPSPATTSPPTLDEPTPETQTDGYEVQLATERSDDGEVTAELIVRRNGQPRHRPAALPRRQGPPRRHAQR